MVSKVSEDSQVSLALRSKCFQNLTTSHHVQWPVCSNRFLSELLQLAPCFSSAPLQFIIHEVVLFKYVRSCNWSAQNLPHLPEYKRLYLIYTSYHSPASSLTCLSSVHSGTATWPLVFPQICKVPSYHRTFALLFPSSRMFFPQIAAWLTTSPNFRFYTDALWLRTSLTTLSIFASPPPLPIPNSPNPFSLLWFTL